MPTYDNLEIDAEFARELEPALYDGLTTQEVIDFKKVASKIIMKNDLASELHLNDLYENVKTGANIDDYTDKYVDVLKEALTYLQIWKAYSSSSNCNLDKIAEYQKLYRDIKITFSDFTYPLKNTGEQSIRNIRM